MRLRCYRRNTHGGVTSGHEIPFKPFKQCILPLYQIMQSIGKNWKPSKKDTLNKTSPPVIKPTDSVHSWLRERFLDDWNSLGSRTQEETETHIINHLPPSNFSISKSHLSTDKNNLRQGSITPGKWGQGISGVEITWEKQFFVVHALRYLLILILLLSVKANKERGREYDHTSREGPPIKHDVKEGPWLTTINNNQLL